MPSSLHSQFGSFNHRVTLAVQKTQNVAFTGVSDPIFLEGDISNLFYGRLIKIDRLAVLQNKAAHANLLCCTDKCSLGTLNKIAKKVTVHVIKLKPVVEGV